MLLEWSANYFSTWKLWGFCTESPFQPMESWEFGGVKFYSVQLLQEC